VHFVHGGLPRGWNSLPKICYPARDLTAGIILARSLLSETVSRHVATIPREVVMVYYALMFFVIAVVVGILGFGGIAVGAVEIAKILFLIFLVLFVGGLARGLVNRRNL
jgi:uncharacterized membrane protein YtjA (UPF0391 family)